MTPYPYLVEFRVQGYAKRYSKELIYSISRKFRVRGMTRKHAVPHITLYGPFNTRNERTVISKFHYVCAKYNRILFSFEGFNYFNNPNGKVIYLDIEPSQELINFRYELSQILQNFTYTNSVEDKKGKDGFKFHSTLAFKDIDRNFNEIWDYVNSKDKPHIKQTLLRVALLKNSKILCEYDFIQRRLFNRKLALNRKVFRRTIMLLKQQSHLEGDMDTVNEQSAGMLTKLRHYFRGN